MSRNRYELGEVQQIGGVNHQVVEGTCERCDRAKACVGHDRVECAKKMGYRSMIWRKV